MKLGKNTFYHGDCLFVLNHDVPAESVDLIYLDPPFFTGKIQKGTKKWQPGAMEISFEDRKEYWSKHLSAMRQKAPIWLNDIGNRHPEFAAYLYYMMERLQACYRVLNKAGSIYLHCDYRASHYLKMVMDEIFNEENFINEIIWAYQGTGAPSKGFKRKHDTLLYYGKSKEFYFNPEEAHEPMTEKTRAKFTMTDETGRKYKHYKHPDGSYHRQYLDETRPMRIRDVWEISTIQSWKEKVGYPTQKPEALLKQIIKASSKEGDLVLDPFCGCGTAAIVASKLNRRFIGIDIHPTAFEVIKNRSHELFNQSSYISRDLDEVSQMGANDFEAWVNEFYSATKPLPDKGVDGITPDGIPIQTKTGKVDYTVVSQFLTNAQLHQKVPQPIKKLIIVSQTSFDDSARKTAFEIKAKFGIEIQLKEPKDLLFT